MGLINLDNYVCSNGVQKTDTYISFANETLYIRQASAVDGTMTYTVSANYRIFWDETARNNGLSFIDLKSIVATIPQDMLTSNMYACLYEELKKIYPNTTDTALRVKAAPVVPTPPNPASTPAPTPVVEAPAPVTPAPVVEAPAPVVEAPAPVTPAPAPVTPAPAPSEPAPAPVVEAPAPSEPAPAPAPVVEAPAPVVEAPAPSEPAPAPAPVVEAPAPSEPAPSV